MLQRTEGVVLRTIQYGEADLIATFLTKDHGIIKVFVKSPRKTKSRFGSSLEPLTYSRIAFWGREDSPMPRLTQADIIRVFGSLRSSFRDFYNISSLIELTLQIVPERDAQDSVYRLFFSMLEYFENGGKWQLGGLYYRLKLLETGGFMPRLRSCGRCGKHSGLFHFCHGTVLCDECSMHEKTSVRVSPAAVALFSTMTKWDFSNIERLRPSEGILAELVSLIEMHISHITERDTASVIA